MTKRFARQIFGLTIVWVWASSAFSVAAERTNVLVVLTDDQGWGDVGVHGNTNLKTPWMDSLANRGASFERFFVCPVCAPTRAEFLTGRYHTRGGVRGVTRGAERLDLDERTIADVFRSAGYATGAFGKWHNGTQYPYHPNGRGFDEYYGFCSGHWGQYFDPILEHNGETVRGEGFIIDDLTDRAIEFMRGNGDAPFFCYVAYNTPHSPFQVPDNYYDRFASSEIALRNRDPEMEELDKTRAALAMCENLDWNLGRLLATLDELDVAESTLVVFFTDNGPNTWRYNGDMKGRKGSTDEGGVRVPCFMRWPGKIEGGRRVEPIAGAIDLLPTLCGLADVDVPNDRPLDGMDLAPLLFGEADSWPERMIFSHQRGRVSVRTDRYRLDASGKLFDMQEDPGQRVDVAGAHSEVAEELRAAVSEWTEAMSEGMTEDSRPFTVGYADFPRAVLPARDGVAEGEIERSARAPNCSYFTHWVRVEDGITWDVEVATAGRYEAVVYYTCGRDDLGSTVEMRLGDAAVTGKVSEAHDPPLVGASDDRAPRGSESFVKDFRPLRLGVMELPEGRAALRLGAVELAGASVMDVRGVTLELVE